MEKKILNFKKGFKLNDVTFIQKKYLLLNELVKKNESQKTLDDMENYIVDCTMGQEMKGENFIPRRLSQGKFLCSYYNPENDVAFIDFLVPDNDNVQGDEIPITTFFFSKWSGMFEVYTEEIMINKPGV